MLQPALYLIPVTLGDAPAENVLPAYNMNIVNNLDEFIVENIRTARRFLRSTGYTNDFENVVFHILNQHTSPEEIPSFLMSLKNGKSIGLLSEAGVPCIADPGSEIVKHCHDQNLKVVPLTGPSSIILALMGSGFNGQQFCFHGYLPIEKKARIRRIKDLESAAYSRNESQIFIETPYRNNQVLQALLSTLSDKTMVCIASNISTSEELILTKSVNSWKKIEIDLNKKPTVFLVYK